MLLAAGLIRVAVPAAEWVLLKSHSLPFAAWENYSTILSTLENSISTGVERPKMLTITFNV
jgi:hypothetical protein